MLVGKRHVPFAYQIFKVCNFVDSVKLLKNDCEKAVILATQSV